MPPICSLWHRLDGELGLSGSCPSMSLEAGSCHPCPEMPPLHGSECHRNKSISYHNPSPLLVPKRCREQAATTTQPQRPPSSLRPHPKTAREAPPVQVPASRAQWKAGAVCCADGSASRALGDSILPAKTCSFPRSLFIFSSAAGSGFPKGLRKKGETWQGCGKEGNGLQRRGIPGFLLPGV